MLTPFWITELYGSELHSQCAYNTCKQSSWLVGEGRCWPCSNRHFWNL